MCTFEELLRWPVELVVGISVELINNCENESISAFCEAIELSLMVFRGVSIVVDELETEQGDDMCRDIIVLVSD